MLFILLILNVNALPELPHTKLISLDNNRYNINNNNHRNTIDIVADYEQRNEYTHTNPYTQKYSYANTQGNTNTRKVDALFKQASTASISVLFILLIWRSLSSYEIINQVMNSLIKTVLLTPTVVIMLANIIGFIVNLTRPMNFKNILKFILACNIFREWIELVFNLIMMVASTANANIPREIYFGRMFMNIWWSAICVSFSRSRWVLQTTIPSSYLNQQQQYTQ